jgi:hypothetical protein
LRIHCFTIGSTVLTTILQIAQMCAFGTRPCNSYISYFPKHKFMAFQYSKVSWKRMTLLVNLVFIGVFSFQWESPTSTHAFCHSLHPLLDFLLQVIVFCSVNCVPFKLNSRKPTQTLVSL